MAYITLNREKLRHNFRFLQRLFRSRGVEWSVVSKLLCGNRLFLEELVRLGVRSMCDSRVVNLKVIKQIDPSIRTIHIRPPALRAIPNIVRYADVSFNTEYRTLQLLSEEAERQHTLHHVVIMIELGERREGVMQHKFVSFYERVRTLPNLRVVGIGTNFACLSGVLPDREKLTKLVRLRDLIKERFNEEIPYISGGTSVTIHLLQKRLIPPQINHFRIGESLFFGTDTYHTKPLRGMYQDVLCLYAAIIELIEKPKTPDGTFGNNLEGHTPEFSADDYGKSSFRAILDVGLLDAEYTHLTPDDPLITHIGASSDMLIVDLGSNPHNYKTGDFIRFRTDYMGALRLMNSRYIHKQVVDTDDVQLPRQPPARRSDRK